MSISKEKRGQILNDLIYEIGKDAYYQEFSVDKFAACHKLSVQSIYRYLDKLESESIIQKQKMGKKNNYRLVDKVYDFLFPIENLKEDVVWNKSVKTLMEDFSEVVLRNSYYAFTEMLNNAIDHSEGTKVTIDIRVNPYRIAFHILDDGIGIFTKIASALNLEEKRFAILELAKGKFTTAPDNHSGEGIFFSSKAVDLFSIYSDNLVFASKNYYDEDENNDRINEVHIHLKKGTWVSFTIFRNHTTEISEIMDKYTEYPDGFGFTKTIVPVRLLEYGDATPMFVSRSQAKRLLSRFERFERIELDFTGVDEIGQGFADEVFRVFEAQHPNTSIIAINCNPRVEKMIKHVSRR